MLTSILPAATGVIGRAFSILINRVPTLCLNVLAKAFEPQAFFSSLRPSLARCPVQKRSCLGGDDLFLKIGRIRSGTRL